MTPDETLGRIVRERIAELWLYRRWWRANRWADWPTVRWELDLELRALVRLARQARKAQAAAEDAMEAAYKGDHYRYPAGVGR